MEPINGNAPSAGRKADGAKGTAKGYHALPSLDQAVDFEKIFEGLAGLARWVPYRLKPKPNTPGKADKIPANGEHNLSTRDPADWMKLAEAKAIAEREGLDGIGIVLTNGIEDDEWRLAAIDADDVDPDGFEPPFPDTYAEMSPSRHGMHLLVWVPKQFIERYADTVHIVYPGCHHLEVYLGTSARFLTTPGATDETFIYCARPPRRLTSEEQAWLGERLKPADATDVVKTPPDIAEGTRIDLTRYTLTPNQQALIEGKGQSDGIDRSKVMRGLLIKLIDAGESQGDILATLLGTETLWRYALDHRNNSEDRAVEFAREEVAKAYKASMTGKKAKLLAFGKKDVPKPEEPDGVSSAPITNHLTTDLANAHRLHLAFGDDLLFMSGQWYVWDGTHWSADRAAAYRQTYTLSTLIAAEIAEWEAKAAGSKEEKASHKGIVVALSKWAKTSEMKQRIDAAFSLLENLVSVEADDLDADPYLLNCANGTVDLRSGKLRPHDKGDRITRVIPVEFHPDAQAPRFENALAQITNEAHLVRRPIAEFLGRWFGYCATGLTDEQKFAVFWGDGANGKSLLLSAIERTLGPYASTAAPGLVVGKSADTHSTDVADLRGKRMVTACESGENGMLKEELIKRITGSDRIKARFLYKNNFEFRPTHKIQLITNHKPQIQGQDHAIWRRVLLVPYGVTFGTASEVAQGAAHFVKDEALGERLKGEAEGILAWIVKGARSWWMTGLSAPDSILAAGAAYKEEQDRVGQFLAECCERRDDATVSLADLHFAYSNWAKRSAYGTLGKNRFAEAVRKKPGITARENAHYKDRFFGEDRRGTVFTGVGLLRRQF